MPYDPRMMQQISQMGISMMGAPQGSPFAVAPTRPKQWWEQPMPSARSNPYNGADQPTDQPGQPTDQPGAPAKGPPSLYDMMLTLGRLTPGQYNKATQAPGPYGVTPKDAGRISPMGFLASLPGWGGGGGAR